MTSVLERNIQIELYRILQNLVEKRFSFNDIEFVGVKYEPSIIGRPDLVVEAVDKGKKIPLLVIETKRKEPFVDRRFDPYSKDVIRQASGYAVELGAPYFATCNGEVLVETAEKWKPHEKPKKERIKPVEPSKRLDTWIER